MKVSFIEPAYLELEDAIDYYNQEIASLGNKFYHEILSTINLIEIFPQIWSINSQHTRKAILKIFPYNIIYTIMLANNNSVIINFLNHSGRINYAMPHW